VSLSFQLIGSCSSGGDICYPVLFSLLADSFVLFFSFLYQLIPPSRTKIRDAVDPEQERLFVKEKSVLLMQRLGYSEILPDVLR
jgi:hypothetical protein